MTGGATQPHVRKTGLAGVSWLALIVLLFVLFSKGFRVVRVYDLSLWRPLM